MSDLESSQTDKHMMEVFFEVQSDLPRQGPGDAKSTQKALELCTELPSSPRVLDIGCGPGAQTLDIAEIKTDAMITAVDFHDPYLSELRFRAEEQGTANRIEVLPADMNDLPLEPESFDLVWAEGSAYIMGVPNALSKWKPLLKSGGYLAFTELVWLTDSPPDDALTFFSDEYPAMAGRESIVAEIENAGYQHLEHFTLPDSAWWDGYYSPLVQRLSALEKKYANDEIGLSVIDSVRKEIAIRESYPESYGYEFFVARKSTAR